MVLGFQGRSQLEKRYGQDAEAMLSQPATKIFFKTSEPRAAKWISETLGEIEVERLKESRTPRLLWSRSISRRTGLYEGVALNDLLPDAQNRYSFTVLKPAWAFRDYPVLLSKDLDLTAPIIVADTIGGKRLRGNNPFVFVAKTSQGQTVMVRNIAYIRFAERP